MELFERDAPEKATSPELALARLTIALGAACEYYDLEAYDDSIRETAFAVLDLARYREIRDQLVTPEAEGALQSCAHCLAEANSAYLSSDYQGARKALALASVHLERYLQTLDPKFAYLREDLLPLIAAPGKGEPRH